MTASKATTAAKTAKSKIKFSFQTVGGDPEWFETPPGYTVGDFKQDRNFDLQGGAVRLLHNGSPADDNSREIKNMDSFTLSVNLKNG